MAEDMPVEIVDYDPAWAERFETERQLLEPALSAWLEGGIHHVGSTAVPGLAAKPVVDIMAGVADLVAARDAVPGIERLGYRFWSWDPNQWRLWFLKPVPSRRTHHLHLIEADHPEFRAKLAFRDVLREDERLRGEYAQLKRELAAAHPTDRDAYTDAKSDFVLAALAAVGLADGVPPRNDSDAGRPVLDPASGA